MKQYKLTIDGQPAWTSFFIQAANDADAAKRAAALSATYGGRYAFTLSRDDATIALADLVAGAIVVAPTPCLVH